MGRGIPARSLIDLVAFFAFVMLYDTIKDICCTYEVVVRGYIFIRG